MSDVSRVLIVEPDARLAGVYARLLRSQGYGVAVATTAQDAVLAADKLQPDIVLLELQLTAHSGIEFLYEFRSYDDWHDIPVVVLSQVPPAEFEASRQILYGRLGVAEYLYKPRTDLQAILSAVAKTLKHAGTTDTGTVTAIPAATGKPAGT